MLILAHDPALTQPVGCEPELHGPRFRSPELAPRKPELAVRTVAGGRNIGVLDAAVGGTDGTQTQARKARTEILMRRGRRKLFGANGGPPNYNLGLPRMNRRHKSPKRGGRTGPVRNGRR